jgi:hypothetical protein
MYTFVTLKTKVNSSIIETKINECHVRFFVYCCLLAIFSLMIMFVGVQRTKCL